MPEEESLEQKAERAANSRPKRGRPRKYPGMPSLSAALGGDGSGNGDGSAAAVATDPETGIPYVDETEVDEIRRQMSPSDKLLCPIEDYRNLSAVIGRAIIWLVKNAIDPYKCTLTVERRAPAFYRGRKVKTGVLRPYGCGWPFDLDTIKTRLESEQGGEEYVFIVKHDGKPLRALNVNIDEPPKHDPELTIGDADITGVEPLDEIEKERIREERMTRLLQTRRSRIRAAKEVKDEEQQGAPPEAPSAAEIAAMQVPQGYSDDEMQRALAEQEERQALRQEIKDSQSNTDRRFEMLLAELRNSKNDGGSLAMVETMKIMMASQMDGLKMVVQNVGEQLRSVSESSKEQFSNVLKMIEISQGNQKALFEAQVSARSRETELLLEAAGAKQEMAMMTADKQMELMKSGMEFARQLQPTPGEGDAELGWANKAGNMLVQLIAGKMATGALAPGQLPTPEQAAAATSGPAPTPVSQEHIDTAAKRIAERVMAKVRLERSAGAVPAASTAPEMGAFVRAAWTKLHAELDTRPARSEFVAMVLAGPPSFMAGIGKAEKITEILTMVAPYVPNEQIGAVGAKLLDTEAQQWTLNQVVQIKAAFAKRQAIARAAVPAQAAEPAPAPAAPPAAPPAPAASAAPPPATNGKGKAKKPAAVAAPAAAPAAPAPAVPEGAPANA